MIIKTGSSIFNHVSSSWHNILIFIKTLCIFIHKKGALSRKYVVYTSSKSLKIYWKLVKLSWIDILYDVWVGSHHPLSLQIVELHYPHTISAPLPEMTSGRCSSSQMRADSICRSRLCVKVWWTHGERFPEKTLLDGVGVHLLGERGYTLCARVVYNDRLIGWFKLHCGMICTPWDVLSCFKTCAGLLNKYISSFHGQSRNGDIWS